MRVLVTGGAGFIGSHFVDFVVENQLATSITVLDSLTYAGSLENLSSSRGRISFVQESINHAGSVDDLVRDSDVVVNFAAETHNDRSLANPRLFFETNVMGTLTLLESCRRFDKRFHHVSTDEVFGDLPLDSKEMFNQDSPYRPSSPYSASKAAADHAVLAWVRSFKLFGTVSNCTNNYGTRQHPEKLIPRTVQFAIGGQRPEVFGSGENSRDWIHVSDHVAGVWKAIEHGSPGSSYLFSAQNNRANLEVVQKILEILGQDARAVLHIPDRPGHDLRYSLDPTATMQELSWSPKYNDILENLSPIVEWYRNRASVAGQ